MRVRYPDVQSWPGSREISDSPDLVAGRSCGGTASEAAKYMDWEEAKVDVVVRGMLWQEGYRGRIGLAGAN